MTQNIRQRNEFCYFCSKNRDFHLAYTLNWFAMDHNLYKHKCTLIFIFKLHGTWHFVLKLAKISFSKISGVEILLKKQVLFNHKMGTVVRNITTVVTLKYVNLKLSHSYRFKFVYF